MVEITPRVDIAFKKIFGIEENKDLLISLINSIVSKDDQVIDVTLLNPYNLKNFANDKLSILDIKAKGHTGKHYNIEIQISDEADYDKRALYYWAKLYIDQLKTGGKFSSLNKTIGIHILNFTSIPEEEKYHNVFRLLEEESKLHYFKDIELHTIELSKFEERNLLNKVNDVHQLLPKIKTALDKWATFLTRYDLLQSTQLLNELKDSNLEKALDVLEYMNFTQMERDAYEDHLKWLRIEASSLDKAKAESRAEGKAEGKVEVAKTMLSKNRSIDEISELTGLSAEEIVKLKLSNGEYLSDSKKAPAVYSDN